MRFTRRNAGCCLSGRNANEIAKNYELYKYLIFWRTEEIEKETLTG
jgi:hypothetical protein